MDRGYLCRASFLELVNQLFFNNELVVESKWSNKGLLDALIDLGTKYDYEYYVACVMKSLVGEFTQSEKWSVKGALMGECWKKVVCRNIRIILSMAS